MKRKKFQILIYVVLLFCMITEVGCMYNPDTMKNAGDKALEFITDKYQKEFTPITYEMSDYLSDTDTVHCYTEGMDPDNEHVEIYVSTEDGKTNYSDNYFSFYIRPEAEAYISSIVAKEFSEFKVYRNDEYEGFPNELTCDSSLDDLYALKPNYWMSVKIYINGDPSMSESEYKNKIQTIENDLISSGHRYNISIFALSDTAYQSIERYTQDDFWVFYSKNPQPDGEKYYYSYNSTIYDGGII